VETGQTPAFVRGGAILVDDLILATDAERSCISSNPIRRASKCWPARADGDGNNWAPWRCQTANC